MSAIISPCCMQNREGTKKPSWLFAKKGFN